MTSCSMLRASPQEVATQRRLIDLIPVIEDAIDVVSPAANAKHIEIIS